MAAKRFSRYRSRHLDFLIFFFIFFLFSFGVTVERGSSGASFSSLLSTYPTTERDALSTQAGWMIYILTIDGINSAKDESPCVLRNWVPGGKHKTRLWGVRFRS